MNSSLAPQDDQLLQLALARRAEEVETVLDAELSPRPLAGEIERPARLLAAMRHGVLNGGKRLRPFLVMECAALFAADDAAALHVAAALECIHCYSLVHDDLPAMDDDDLRRGLPTVHRAFDEATAILAGDALLTLAFDLVCGAQTDLQPAIKAELASLLARAAGLGGMAGGQALDLQAATDRPDETGIIRLQAMKTGALIRFACEAGAVLGKAGPAEREALVAYGEAIGLAFQLADDLLDATGDAAALGKAARKDEAAGKATLVSLHGEEWARAQLEGLVAQASALLDGFAERASVLKATARFIANRQS
jgi:farnesyl diphosphate synthase